MSGRDKILSLLEKGKFFYTVIEGLNEDMLFRYVPSGGRYSTDYCTNFYSSIHSLDDLIWSRGLHVIQPSLVYVEEDEKILPEKEIVAYLNKRTMLRELSK